MNRLVVGLVMLCAVAQVAHADEGEAKRYYERGVKAFDLQEFSVALSAFRGAYVEKPDPAFLFNIAQCQRQLGQWDAAGKSYRAYLNRSRSTDPVTQSAVQRVIEQMEQAAREAHARVPPMGTQAPVATSAPRGATIPATPTERSWYHSPLGWSLAGVGIAGVAVSIGLLAHAGDLDHQLASASSIAQAQQLEANRDSFRTAGYTTLAVGAAVAVAGGVVLGVTAARRRHLRSAWIAPTISERGMVLSFGGTL